MPPSPPLAGQPRIAFLLPDMRGGGAERVALTVITDLAARGLAIDLILMEAAGELLPLVPPSVRVIDLKAPRIRAVAGPLVRYLKSERPAGIQISMWPLTVVGIAAARLARTATRVVVSDHIALSKQYPGRLQRLAIGASTRLLYPRADARIMVSADAATDLAQLSGLDPAAFEIIYNPIPAAPEGEPARNAANEWRGTGARLLTVGSLKAQKNQAMLLQALAELTKTQPASLLILGEGDERPALERLAVELGVADRVAMPGFTTDPWPYYAAADLFVLSSDYEGFGNVLVEAMRCGLPVVSTDCRSGPREILSGGRYGKLVPVGDPVALAAAMAAALADPGDADARRARAEELSGATSIDRYLALMLPEHS